MKCFYNKIVIRILAIATLAYVMYYLWWRISFTLNPANLVFSLILLLAEIIGLIEFCLFLYMTWAIDDGQQSLEPLNSASVDVFVPTYNEELEILESTLLGCNLIRYPHTTYVLDDGHRPEVRMLADRLGCRYLSREKNEHAKAGNINAALSQTSGEFIVVLDADMVPQPDILDKTLGYFRKEKTAIVQLPQEFYNLDSAQHDHNPDHWHEQQLFYHVIQPGKNRINAPFWCGSPSVVRRAALESIGGVATQSITEDFLTSIRLNSKGWNIRYHNEALAFGIAPQSIHAYKLQRLRWAQGAMKILKSKDNPLIAPGLSMKQRISHFSAIFTYFSAYQKLIYLLVPSVILFTGMMPLAVSSGFGFMTRWAVYFLLVMLTNKALGRGYFKYFEVEKHNTIKMFTFIRASFSLFISKKLEFKVTPKHVEQSLQKKDRREMKSQIGVLLIVLASVVVGIVVFVVSPVHGETVLTNLTIALFWAVFNSAVILLALADVFKRLFKRQDYRFTISIPSKIVLPDAPSITAVAGDISVSGLSLILSDKKKLSSPIEIELTIPTGKLRVTGRIVYAGTSNGVQKAGVKFDQMDNITRERLYIYLFVTLPRMIYDDAQRKFSNPGASSPQKGFFHDCRRRRYKSA